MDGLLDAARAALPHVVELRRRLHRTPEVGLELPRTQALVLEALDGLDLAVSTGRSLSSVVAVLDGGSPGPTVLLRADMDALPIHEETGLPFASEHAEAMHACGHDAHMAMLIGAARLLAERRPRLAGRVLFMFQPGEESPGGAAIMLDEGLLEAAGPQPPVATFALHVVPTLPAGVAHTRAGPLMASSDILHAVVRGRGGHAAAPHVALDPIPVAAEAILAMQTYVARRVDPLGSVVLTVASVEAGTTSNVIPETATLLGTLRALSEGMRANAKRDVVALIEGIAAAHGLRAEAWFEDGYPVTQNDAAAAAFALATAREVLGPDRSVEIPQPIMASEDFSYVLQRVPGAMVFLGVRPPDIEPEAAAPLHSNRMTLDEDAMAAGVALYAAFALRKLGRLGP
jgi:amidohydrolase